jgi:hypothetical protein
MTRASPEFLIQRDVKRFLTYCLPLPGPDYVEWTSSQAGAHLGAKQRIKAKASGLRPGWPDLQFLLPTGRTHYIEIKAPGGSLSAEQRAFRDLARPHGLWALCRSVDEVEATLRGWGVKLRSRPFAPLTEIEQAA